MNDPTTDTLTFLFTDIEGSTRLWEHHPEAMKRAHARHCDIIAEAVEQHGGTLVRSRGEGDSTFSTFTAASAAVAAALAMQVALHGEPWPEDAPIRVRAGLHLGEAHHAWGDYNSSAVNRCARIRSLAYGGQTLVSQAVYEVTEGGLPEGAGLRSLGAHRLKDLEQPETLYQLVHPDLPDDFPTLRSLDSLPTNLPQQLTSFIGRERDLREVKRLLEAGRLVTLTGAGGCGKTRLAMQAAADSLDRYEDGVWLCELAALSDEGLVEQAVAAAVGVREQAGRPIGETLADELRPKQLLLLLDNCEHLIGACARLADRLLKRCPQVTILATSQEPLGVPGETAWRVPSLLVPDPSTMRQPDDAARCEAVKLFVERACAAQPGFRLTQDNAATVAQVCRRLDGIPLAIELAAARVRMMAPDQIAARLDDRFRLLTGGSRTALPRQQTLRALVDWSYGLLDAKEKGLLDRLSVFAGGWSLEAAEAVCSGGEVEEWEILDLLTRLVDKSLVIADDAGGTSTRYRMLETVRQYASDRLNESGGADTIRDQHIEYVCRFTEEASPGLDGTDQEAWLVRLDAEHDNIRAALDWAAASPERADEGVRIVAAVAQYWDTRSHLEEGRRRIELALSAWDEAEPTFHYVKAMNKLATMTMVTGSVTEARQIAERSLKASMTHGDKRLYAGALSILGLITWMQRDYAAAERYHTAALEIRQGLDMPQSVAASINNLGILASEQGDFSKALTLYTTALDLYSRHGGRLEVAMCHNNLGEALRCLGELSQARTHYEKSLALYRGVRNGGGIALALTNLSDVARAEGKLDEARELIRESVRYWIEGGAPGGVPQSLESLARVEADVGHFAEVALVSGAAAALREASGIPLPQHEREGHRTLIEQTRAALGDAAFEAAWAAGSKMSTEDCVRHVLEGRDPMTA